MTNVLLIDDDIELTNLLGEYLTEEGFVVETTADGRIGVAEAMSPSTDIVVLDIMMPRMSGIEVLRKIRQVSDVPVLMLTARGDDVDRISVSISGRMITSLFTGRACGTDPCDLPWLGDHTTGGRMARWFGNRAKQGDWGSECGQHSSSFRATSSNGASFLASTGDVRPDVAHRIRDANQCCLTRGGA
ncbi:CheY-like chemotaxis protein [Rhizobium brockwellii]